MNKRYICTHKSSISLLASLAILHTAITNTASSSPTHVPLHEKGFVTAPVQRICAILGAQVTTLEEANTFAQAKLLRRADIRFRKQEHDLLPVMETNKSELMAQLTALGLVHQIKPEKKDYEHAIILSDHRFIIEKRLNHLKSLLEEGYQFKKIVLMAAELQIEPEEAVGLPEGMHKQTDMMLHVYKQYDCFKDIPVIIVSPPMETRPDGTVVRPNTDSQYRDFLKKDPTPGPCLVFSSAPQTLRQTAVGKRLTDQATFPLSATGPVADKDEHIVIFHDELARLVYETLLAFKKEQR